MSKDDSIKTIRILPFSGKEKDWNRWSKTFFALSAARGYQEELVPPSGHTSEADKKASAYNDLLLACQEDIIFGIVDEANGDPAKAWKSLKQKFEPSNGAAKLQLKRKYQGEKLDLKEDPDEYFTRLELIRRRLGLIICTYI